MGFAATCGVLQAVVRFKNELEFRLQTIQQQRLYWADVANKLMMAAARDPGTYEPGKPKARLLEARRAQIAQIDKMLEMEANKLDIRREFLVSGLDGIRKTISKQIQQGFSLMGSG